MKKIIGLVIALMTILNLSVLAQCPPASEKPVVYGDFTPCKNSNLIYSLGNYFGQNPITWTWCRGIANQLPTSAGFVPTVFRWTVDPNSGVSISDGVNTSGRSTGALTTTSTSVLLKFRSKATFLTVYYQDSCGVFQNFYSTEIFLRCINDQVPTSYGVPSAVDTGKTLLNATVIHAVQDMSFNFDSIAGLPKPYQGIQILQKINGASCLSTPSGGLVWRTDGYYTPIRQSPTTNLPFGVVYGWGWYFANATTPPRTFRLKGIDGNGDAFETLPFTISTTVYSNNNYTTLP